MIKLLNYINEVGLKINELKANDVIFNNDLISFINKAAEIDSIVCNSLSSFKILKILKQAAAATKCLVPISILFSNEGFREKAKYVLSNLDLIFDFVREFAIVAKDETIDFIKNIPNIGATSLLIFSADLLAMYLGPYVYVPYIVLKTGYFLYKESEASIIALSNIFNGFVKGDIKRLASGTFNLSCIVIPKVIGNISLTSIFGKVVNSILSFFEKTKIKLSSKWIKANNKLATQAKELDNLLKKGIDNFEGIKTDPTYKQYAIHYKTSYKKPCDIKRICKNVTLLNDNPKMVSSIIHDFNYLHDNLRTTFPDCHEYLQFDWAHILLPDLKYSGNVKGLHSLNYYDPNSSSLKMLLRKSYGTDKEVILFEYNGQLVEKTMFPHWWTLKDYIQKFKECFVRSNIEEIIQKADGRFSIISKTNCDFKIEIFINKEKNKVFTIYPKFKNYEPGDLKKIYLQGKKNEICKND